MLANRLAPAKINLALHVTGKRDDGYHLLDSLVGFTAFGDVIELSAGADDADMRLAIAGPFADALAGDDDNLILQAARAIGAHTGKDVTGFEFLLEKNLPVASGIGGGSADAAAALKLVNEALGLPLDDAMLAALGAGLGADIPVCLKGASSRMTGIGEQLADVALPPIGIVLVNPLSPVSTAKVFARLDGAFGPQLPAMPALKDLQTLAGYLEACRNDLEAPALALCPAIGEVKAALQTDPDCRFARMSGSGATLFGLCENEDVATKIAARITDRARGWWAQGSRLI